MTASFTFDAPFQRSVLRLMMLDDAFCAKALQYIDKGHFTSESLGWIFKTLSDYWSSYHMRCTEMPLRDAVRRLNPQYASRYAHEVEAVIRCGNVPEREWVKAQLKDFCQQAVFAVAHQQSAQLFNDGKQREAYDVMARAQERIVDIDFDQADRIWLFDELEQRQQKRWREQIDPTTGVFTTGIPELDGLTDGGVHLSELWVVFAYAKRCKTTWLINQGFNATRVHRQPTVHFVLEGKGEQIAARYDSCFSQELYSRVKRGQIDAQLYQQLYEEYMTLRRLMVIRTLNSWDITILDLQAELQYLKSQGFDPNMAIVDYMDLGRARHRVDSEREHQVAFARDLKRLLNNEEMGGWSAWQAQRPKPGAHTREHVLNSGNVADAYAKVRIVDAYGSLNATDEEMDRGEMRYFQEGHRDAPVNKLWTITNDLARMRMITSAIEYVPPEQGAKNEFGDAAS